MKILIIGGVAGGASAAARLRRLDEEAEIILFERGGYISFANCGLPYYIGGEIKHKEALTLQSPESFHSRFAVDVRICSEITAIHTENKTVEVLELSTGQSYREDYDRLILSTGAEPLRPPIEGIGSEGVFTLRDIPDAYGIKEFIEQKKPSGAVVVGGGYIGVEMAENLKKAGLEVTVIEMARHLIAAIDDDTACDVHSYLRAQGVSLILSGAVTAILPEQGRLSVRLDSGRAVNADLVVMSVGVRPESGLAKQAGLAVDDRGCIEVNQGMQTSDPYIYAVGDVTSCVNYVTGAKDYLPLAGPANRQGRVAADQICGLESLYTGTQGSAVLKIFDMTVACTGISEKTAIKQGLDYEKVYTYPPSHATYYPGADTMAVKLLFERETGRILGGQFAGFSGVDKRCDVLATAIRGNMTTYDLTQLELCYAPPFSSAKDPLNMAGFVAENIRAGRVRNYHWEQAAGLDPAKVTMLDVRTAEEYQRGHAEGFRNLPVDELRERLGELEPDRPVYVCCHSGLRSYIACCILSANRFEAYNISGGWLRYASLRSGEGFMRLG